MVTPRRFHSLNVLCTSAYYHFLPSNFFLPLDLLVDRQKGISSAPILILIALLERRPFLPNRHPSPPVAPHPELRTRGLRRFGARADVETLLDLFAESHDDGVDPPVICPQIPCSLIIEGETEAAEENNRVARDKEWQKELKERLGNIEAALLELSKHRQ
jgi:hypothetical protein